MVPERIQHTSRRSFNLFLASTPRVKLRGCIAKDLAGLAIYFNLSTFTGVRTSARCLVHLIVHFPIDGAELRKINKCL